VGAAGAFLDETLFSLPFGDDEMIVSRNSAMDPRYVTHFAYFESRHRRVHGGITAITSFRHRQRQLNSVSSKKAPAAPTNPLDPRLPAGEVARTSLRVD